MQNKSLLKQHNIPWIGGLKDILTMVAFYMSMINFGLIILTSYEVTLGKYIKTYLPWFNILYFYLLMFIILGLAMLFEYKFIYPSLYAFRNKQEYSHQNLLRGDLKEIKERLEKIEKALEK
jgi:hypothetical protein